MVLKKKNRIKYGRVIKISKRFEEIINMIENFGCNHPSYWGCALAGEVGEACNLIKKHERDGIDIKDELGEELGDVFIYTVLTAHYFGINLEKEIIKKIEIIKERRKEKE